MSTSRPSPRRGLSRKGLTLIELLVVLTILIALGGLLIPVVGNALTRSHVATCSSTIPETANMLNTAIALRGTIGDGWTTGVFGAGAGAGEPVNNSAATPGAGTFFSSVAGGSNPVSLAVGTLTQPEIDALNELGISTVYNHGDPSVADYDITFNAGLAAETLGTTTEVIVLTTAQADGVNLPTAGGEKYVWFGLDREWDLLGTVTPEAPVHFGDTDGALPNQAYSRFGAVIKVAEDADLDGTITADEALPVAQFTRVSYCLDGDNFETADNHIGIFWQEVFE